MQIRNLTSTVLNLLLPDGSTLTIPASATSAVFVAPNSWVDAVIDRYLPTEVVLLLTETEYRNLLADGIDCQDWSVISASPARLGALSYKAKVTQTGTNAPVVNKIVENQIGNIVWTRTNAGVYTGTLIGAFAGMDIDCQGGVIEPATQRTWTVRAGTNDTIILNTSAAAVLTDGLLTGFYIEFRILPS